jgi:hypothetical protein
VRYSVAPQGLYAGANIGKFSNLANRNSKLNQIFLKSEINDQKWEINNLMLL